MSPQGNQYEYANEGNLHSASGSVPARVKTSLCVMSQEDARQAWIHRLPHGFPRYTFKAQQTRISDELPTHPSLEATGRHYFTW